MTVHSSMEELLNYLLEHPEGNVYSAYSYEIYRDLGIGDELLTNLCIALRKKGYEIITFKIERNVHRIQINQNDSQLLQYKHGGNLNE